MADFSFDVVSKVDMTLVDESVNIALKEVSNRYDFKDSNSEITVDKKENKIYLTSSDEYKVKSLYDVLLTRMSKRGLPLKNFTVEKIENALGSRARMIVKIQQGIPSEKAKEMVKLIKDAKFKVTPQIQGDTVRVFSRSKDELQAVISMLKSKDFGVSLIFTNYR
ncbi:MAG TPA: YajQ family cyclic di-GMP-binding protein [Elusimicrobiales bacterium]|nr:YajQ family cyclic di-GMP-binding protein [Elusimicrobiales bacterium]HOL62467.1 YajQ family cyclic di-GMP-binding protein [Elusimicrobiales bacterium]HPO95499.1 YajQ family cyclic di-GMP-binding protein [Elusimicrobiales bacterium]